MDNIIKQRLESEASFIHEYIDFDGAGESEQSDTAKLQSMGVAALWHRIQEDNFAYLADEVGMGKTRQAMGVIATQFLRKPDSRVVIICPGKPLQDQWKSEWHTFISCCLRENEKHKGDGVLKSALDSRVKQPLALHNRLSEFANSLLLDEDRLHLLRYSSFSRPIGFNGKDSRADIESFYKEKLKEIGISELNAEEKDAINPAGKEGEKKDGFRKDLTTTFNTLYAKRIKTLLEGDTRPIDLIVCDEAQYLRHEGNSRNRNINLTLGSKPNKWLFLSATPLHSGQSDIECLDHYICTHDRDGKTYECGVESCINIKARMKGKLEGQGKTDVIDVLDDFMVRRPRYYSDAVDNNYDKVSYRSYKVDAAVATDDAFSSMVTALVQKRLVQSLGGKNNRFRQGECSSFESLNSSVKRIVKKDSDGVLDPNLEFENLGSSIQSGEVPPDRADIDQLNESLRKVLVDNRLATESDVALKNLPHPKLYHVADQLVENCLKNARNHKTLVFVRRLATVEELINVLQQRYQKLVDQRIESWSSAIESKQFTGSNKQVFSNAHDFWSINEPDENDGLTSTEEEGDDSTIKDPDLLYFKAISKNSGKQENNGMLYSFLTRLLQPTSSDGKKKNPLEFLVPNNENRKDHWASSQWHELLIAIFDADEKQPEWLIQESHAESILMLKRCILQSMRRSDFLVDLYILNGFINLEGKNTLSEKLIWIFNNAKSGKLSPISADLHEYFNNWRKRLKEWCLNFELIRSKCFQSGVTDIDAEFRSMGPVVGRSGNLANKYAVTQFKMPCYPNILICTDVLKEGVDMHLFCDEVIHYGVAWTSGDLEQRIGRVDRVNSLINRRIKTHEGGRDFAPRLKAGFPYLAGTLDQYQVKRVVNEKMLSDLRMDFGKREDEIKDISIDDVFNDSAEKSELSKEFKTREFIPKSLTLKGELLQSNNFPYHDCATHGSINDYEQKLQDNITVKDIYPMPVLIIEHKIPVVQASYAKTLCDNLKTKWEYKKVSGKKRWIENYEVLVPLSLSDQEMGSVISELGSSGQVLEPTPILSLPEAKGFEFDESLNTLARTAIHEAPYKQATGRDQTVIIENIGNLLLVRSPIVSIEHLKLSDSNLAIWIGEENNKRKWGYINDHEGIIWFCCLISHPDKLEDVFETLLNKISQTADRLQQLYTAEDKDEWSYKSNSSFSLVKEQTSNNKELIQEAKVDTNFRANVVNWHRNVFKQVVSTLADEIGADEDSMKEVLSNLEKSERLVQRGVASFSMPENPALRFRVQSFLDVTENEIMGFEKGQPVLIWEIAVNPTKMGRPPELGLDHYDDLPHLGGNFWEHIESAPDTNIFTYQDDQSSNRWFLIYHSASMLDGRTQAFLHAWRCVVDRMRNNSGKFMKASCANDFDIFGE
jgi:hypothetical protein